MPSPGLTGQTLSPAEPSRALVSICRKTKAAAIAEVGTAAMGPGPAPEGKGRARPQRASRRLGSMQACAMVDACPNAGATIPLFRIEANSRRQSPNPDHPDCVKNERFPLLPLPLGWLFFFNTFRWVVFFQHIWPTLSPWSQPP